AINQPYFFPYLSYFTLIKHAERFIILDIVQFVHQSWIRRNRLLKLGGGWQYIMVPTNKVQRGTLIKDVTISQNQDWKQEILCKLKVYEKSAPYYKEVIDVVDSIFERDYINLTDLCINSLKRVCDYLEIENDIVDFKEMDVRIKEPEERDEWALNICKAIADTDEYWNLPLGTTFYDRTKYTDAGIQIRFVKNNLREYNQFNHIFEPGLSILDVMMFNDKETINEMLDDFIFV
ncbi:MAG: WbqC family protein, partial [Bacteroidales bacterium]|nr:WbqC family protein [Bacteroidales bacterium]